MLKLLKISPSHEDLFIGHYQRLLGWSLQLTEHDRDLAEDLLHDAFIHFTTLTQPNLKTIQNLDGYFYGMLRNLHLSQERRSSRGRFQQLSIVEYESAATGLKTIDARDLIRVQDDLRRVCHYACARKEKAKLASVLILRFFHGYYPSEIARILRSPRPAVDKWLQIARAEAKLALTRPTALGSRDARETAEFLPASFARTTDDLLNELRHTILQTRRGECLELGELDEFYPASEAVPMHCERLSHVVSCEDCLDEINKMLKLPTLSDRYPTDSIGKDSPPKNPSGGAGGDAGGRDAAKTAVSKYRRRAKEAFEHRPQELCVSVNGYIQGSHRIGSELVELDLSANLAEEVGFVEVFSEQGIRLLLLNAEEPPPNGSAVQTSRAELSDGRTLELTLKFGSSWPTLQLIYQDPTFKAVESGVWSMESGVESQGSAEVQSPKSKVQSPLAGRTGRWRKLRQRLSDVGLWTWDLGLLWRPGAVTAVFALLLIAVFVIVQFRRGPEPEASAAELLRQSALAEEAAANRGDQVLHRTIDLEEKSTRGELLARRRIEVWQSAERGITARRLYDEHGRLIAGDWRRADGIQTLYHHGARPQVQLVPEKRGAGIITFDNVWQLSPSAREFSSQVERAGQTRVEETATSYVVSSAGEIPDSTRVLRATLVLRRADLHAIEQTLLVRQGSETREFRLKEASFEHKSPSAVAPAIFEPEPELLRSETETRRRGETENVPPSLRPPLPPSPVVATLELEVEVLGLLSQARADLGEQIDVTRTPDGLLLVKGIVETAPRKEEILLALASVMTNSTVNVDISSEAEAEQRRNAQAGASSAAATVQQAEPAANELPVDRELRRYFSARGLSPNQIDQEISRFANRSLNLSRQALRHAWALKRLAERFSKDELRRLEPPARAQWLAMIRGHAKAFQQASSALRQHLGSFLPMLPADDAQDFDIGSDEDLVRAGAQLVDLASASNRSVQSAFTLPGGVVTTSEIGTPKFWRLLKRAELLAAKIADSQ